MKSLSPSDDSGGSAGTGYIQGQEFESVYFNVDYYEPTSYSTYPIGGRYSRFSAKIASSDRSVSTHVLQFEVYLDGTGVYAKRLSYGEIDEFSIVVTGAKVLRLGAVCVSGCVKGSYSDSYAVFANPTLS